MRLSLAAVGRLRPYYRQAADEYARRIQRVWPLEELETREAGQAGNNVAQRQEEGKRLRAVIPAGSMVIALDVEGRGWSSEQVAQRLARWRDGGHTVCFVIGGAVGLDPTLVAGAAERWSLGPLTLPHQLARVVVLEQLYRAGTILAGQPYHKG
jgi:23S rRNA (pseudouridine1915-N3)-methyltransferase